ncbi:MAG: transglutaminase-like domain-containing protein [Clostridia bacterium]|nr:transglutaminase-like domain-containing protein [Clostridia bacterium]
MRKNFRRFLTALVLTVFLANSLIVVSAAEGNYIEANGVSMLQLPEKVNGKISLTGETTNQKIKVLIRKEKVQDWFDVKLNNGKFNEEIWLINGSGDYEVCIMVNLSDNKYTYGPRIKVENVNEVNKFLVPTKHVESNDAEIIDIASKIVKDSRNDLEKARKIYDWVTKNIKYDYVKYKKQLANNFDNEYGAVNTLKTKKGVCYDYSTLVAAIGRATGMQVKVIKGDYKSKKRSELHAWNEIYIAEQDRWINIDTTFGYAFNKDYFDNSDFDKEHVKIDEY